MDSTEKDIDVTYQDRVPMFKDELGVLKDAHPKMLHKLKLQPFEVNSVLTFVLHLIYSGVHRSKLHAVLSFIL